MDSPRRDDGRKMTRSDCKPDSERDTSTKQMAALNHKLELHPCDGRPAYLLGPRARLYRSSHIIALTFAFLALLVVLPLVWTFGLPWLEASDGSFAFGMFGNYEETLRKQDQFLIGVGKADITGYGGHFSALG
jgi:hypothetical protein